MLYLSLFFPKNCHPTPYALHPTPKSIIRGYIYFPRISQIITDLNNILSFTLYTLHFTPSTTIRVHPCHPWEIYPLPLHLTPYTKKYHLWVYLFPTDLADHHRLRKISFCFLLTSSVLLI